MTKKITNVKNQIDYLTALFHGALALLALFGITILLVFITQLL
jgi:hypothetical protein